MELVPDSLETLQSRLDKSLARYWTERRGGVPWVPPPGLTAEQAIPLLLYPPDIKLTVDPRPFSGPYLSHIQAVRWERI